MKMRFELGSTEAIKQFAVAEALAQGSLVEMRTRLRKAGAKPLALAAVLCAWLRIGGAAGMPFAVS